MAFSQFDEDDSLVRLRDTFARIQNQDQIKNQRNLMSFYKNGEVNLVGLNNSFEDKFGDELRSLTNKNTLLEAAGAVVGLSSYTGPELLFACSGTIVCESSDQYFQKRLRISSDRVYIITSASLVRRTTTDPVDILADDLEIKVHLSDGACAIGQLFCYDWHYNLAIISFERIGTVYGLEFFTSLPCASTTDVFALGRHYTSADFMVAHGSVLVSSSHKYDCQELMYSSCKITKCGIGGPLLDRDGNWIGLNFFDFFGDKETPFLPSLLLVKCWYQLNRFRKICHPLLGLRLRSLSTIPIVEHEKIFQKFPYVSGLKVVEVVNGSPAYLSGIHEGVIISEIDGVKIFSVAQLAVELLSIVERHKNAHERSDAGEIVVNGVCIKDVNDGTTQCKRVTLVELGEGQYNRWLVPEVTAYLKTFFNSGALEARGFTLH